MTALKSNDSSEENRGFTLIEILIVIGMLAILATVVLVAVNPLRQFAQARNSQRQANVSAILNALSNRIADNQGLFETASTNCSTPIPTTSTVMGNGTSEYNIRPCLVPQYLSELPFDPMGGANTCTDTNCTGKSYITEYTIVQETTSNRITVCAPKAAESTLASSTAFCLTR